MALPMPFTPEQQSIITSTARIVRANAFAGTGKSTTLRGVAAARPSERGLLVAFNKSIQLDAEATFPTTVRCRTSHALAFPKFGRLYTGGRKLQGDIKPFHIEKVTASLTRSMPLNVARIFDQRVVETIKAYLVSADDDLGLRHVVLGTSPVEANYISEHSLLQAAAKVWEQMRDPRSDVPMLHDGYFKLYQLSRPTLHYDFILFDEAQDSNPTLQAIVAQQQCRVIYVGDQHQAIYGFRGAHNAMQTLAADAAFYLTGSFRFGQEVANVANRILALKGETVELRGLGEATEVFIGPMGSPRGTAFISRTNAAVFSKAFDAVTAKVPVAFVGGIGTYKFEIGEDISRLRQGDATEVRNPFIASFDSFEALAEYADTVQDRELVGWKNVVERYGRRFDHALSMIRANALQYDSADASQRNALTVVTAHRCKGLEFDRVELAENFVDTIDEETGKLKDFRRANRETQEEINLLYVAATRAKHRLGVNQSIAALLDPAFAAEPMLESAAAP